MKFCLNSHRVHSSFDGRETSRWKQNKMRRDRVFFFFFVIVMKRAHEQGKLALFSIFTTVLNNNNDNKKKPSNMHIINFFTTYLYRSDLACFLMLIPKYATCMKKNFLWQTPPSQFDNPEAWKEKLSVALISLL